MGTVLGLFLVVEVMLGLLGLCAIMYSSVLEELEKADRTGNDETGADRCR
jgi:hypothetical protein